jgi:hypothetical protein
MIAKDLGKEMMDQGAKKGIKLIPGISLGIAGFMAAVRGAAGDYKGAALEMASGGLAFVPGWGTAGAVGVDAYLLARDLFQHYYGHLPDETNPEDRELFLNDLVPKVQSYVSEQAQILAAQGVDLLPIDQAKELFNSLIGAGGEPIVGKAQYLEQQMNQPPTAKVEAQPPAPRPEMTPDEAQRTLMGSTNGPRTREGIGLKLPLPKQKITQEQISSIGNPTGAGPNNVTINKQGDTINNVTNNTNAGGGAAGVSGSPSRVPSPFDYLLYGDSFNWGY